MKQAFTLQITHLKQHEEQAMKKTLILLMLSMMLCLTFGTVDTAAENIAVEGVCTVDIFAENIAVVGTCGDLVDNCLDTAEEAYSDGDYSAGMFEYMVVVCVNAYLNCRANTVE